MGARLGSVCLCQCIVLLCVLFHPAASLRAEDAAEDLKAYGRKWNEIQAGWEAEQNLHKQTMDKLKSGPQTPETQRQIDSEINRHSGRSKEFAGQRQVIQDKIISEANRRTASGQQQETTSKPGSRTAGTDPTSAKGRGMAGDGDYGSGPRTADKVQGVLDDMGIKTQVKSTPSTIEIGDGMNMTVNKEGALGRPGSGAHQTQVQVDAHTKDTYVSESMVKEQPEMNGEPKKPGQPGRDYVQVQDHKKKALGGLNSDPADLPRNPEGARDMVKGATKSLQHLPPAEAEAILSKHGLTPDDMTAIKEGRANVTPENAQKIQNASREVIEAAETRTRAKADTEIAQTQKDIAAAEAAGNKAEAQRLRDQLVDSNTKIKETTKANAEMDGQGRRAATAADTPDGKSRGPLADAPDGTTRGPATDAPDGSGRGPVVDSPDGQPRGPAADAPEGKFGKALDKVGKGMQAVDILSGAQDFKEAAKKGDLEGMGKAAVNTADGLVGGVKGTVDTLVTKGGDRSAAQEAIDQANRSHLENQNQQIAIDLQRSGMSKEDIKEVLDAKARGDEGPLRDSYEKIGKSVPTLVVEKPVEGDDTWKDRGAQVLTGMGEKTVKAGTFVKETVEDVGEIATGLTEKGVAGELIDQQKKNLAPSNLGEGFEAAADTIKAGRDEASARDSLADKLVEKGASPEEAAKAAEAWSAGDRSQLDALKEKLGLPVAGSKPQGETTDDKQAADKKDTVGTAQDKRPAAGDTAKGERGDRNAGTEETAGQKSDEQQGGETVEGSQPVAGGNTEENTPAAPAGPVNHAGQQVDPGSYGQGDMVVSPDGTEYEKQGDTWVPTGNNYGSYEPQDTPGNGQDPLKGSEPSTNDTPWTPAGSEQGGGSTLDQYAGQHETEREQKTQGSMMTMGQNSQLGEAANVSNQALADAQNIRETGARDADAVQTESVQETTKQDSKNSWGNVLGDAVAQGVQEGTEEFGETLGERGADAVADDVFGESHHDGKGSRGGGEGHHGGAGNAVAGDSSSGQDQHDDSSVSGGSDSGHGGESSHGHDQGDSSSGDVETGGEDSGSDHESGAADDEPGAADDEPGAADEEPGAADDEPGAGDDESVAGVDEPGAGDDEPGAGDDVSGAGNDEPGSGDDKPGDGDDEPGTTDSQTSTTKDSDTPPASLLEEAYQKGLRHGRQCKSYGDSTTLACVLGICHYNSVDPKSWAPALEKECNRGTDDGYAGK